SCGKPAYLIDGVHDLDETWLAGAETVLITAGASAPEEVVETVVRHLERRFGATTHSRTIREEHVRFPLPRELRHETTNDETRIERELPMTNPQKPPETLFYFAIRFSSLSRSVPPTAARILPHRLA